MKFTKSKNNEIIVMLLFLQFIFYTNKCASFLRTKLKIFLLSILLKKKNGDTEESNKKFKKKDNCS